jgi:hypothetical protein
MRRQNRQNEKDKNSFSLMEGYLDVVKGRSNETHHQVLNAYQDGTIDQEVAEDNEQERDV